MTDVINLNQKWHIGDQLGAGGFGRVHLAQSELGKAAVIKLIPKAPGAARELLFEDLDGVPNVVPILDRGEWKDSWVLVMPKADKSLRDHLSENGGRLSLNDTVQVLSDVAQALAALDGQVVHRDIKPDNILLLDGRWCLADFGISRYAGATTAPDTHKYSMTPPYAAPEQWRGEQATSATDLYALGVVAYELLAGELPFAGPEIHDYRGQHLDETSESIHGVPLKLQSLIDECLYKPPEARPRPQNLLARLQNSMQPGSEAANRLQQANALEVQRRAEASRQESVAKSDAERRSELLQAADRSLDHVAELLNNQILSNAPASERTNPSSHLSHWSWSLNEAKLHVRLSRMAEPRSRADTYGPLFEIIAYSDITLQVPPDRYGYEGRAHSLWYCDAKDAGVFRWYETAFMFSPLIPKRGRINPFALGPGREACIALCPATAEYQPAWPFTPIDQGDEDEFLERWIGWFADAAQGLLRHPTKMPERDPNNTWRRGD